MIRAALVALGFALAFAWGVLVALIVPSLLVSAILALAGGYLIGSGTGALILALEGPDLAARHKRAP